MKNISHSRPDLSEQEASAVRRVLKSNFIAEGSESRKFGEEFAAYIGRGFAMPVNSGTASLHCALLALSIGPGDEVIVPNYTCRSVLNAVQYTGAKPVICDVDRRTFNVIPDLVKKLIGPKTKAVIAAHMFGCPVELAGFKKMGIPLIEDCAQSIGADYKGKKVGSFGDLAIFSFEGTKTITTGEGGMVVTNSRSLIDKLRRIKEPYSNDVSPKFTYRLSDLQAAVGRVQLRKLDSFIKKRRSIAELYFNKFKNIPGVELPDVPDNVRHTFHRFILTLNGIDPDRVIRHCQAQGVLVKRAIKPYVLSDYLKLKRSDFPNTDFIMKNCISIPIYPSLTTSDLRRVIKVVRSAIDDEKS